MKTFGTKLSVALAVLAAWAVWAVPASAEQSLDSELEDHWATERDLDVLEQRLFERDGRFGAGISIGLLTSEPFFYYYPVGARVSYFFSNRLGVEAGGSFMDASPLNHNTELTDFLYDERDTFDSSTDTQDRFLWRANAMALWSPFYGKLAALQQKLLHFDINFGAGFGAVGVERPQWDNLDGANPEVGDEPEQTVAPEFVIGAGVHFFVDDDLVVRLDGRGYLYQGAELPSNTDNTFGRLSFPVEFNIGATYMF